MVSNKRTAVVLAAGMGTRMRSSVPKVMHKIAGRSIIEHVIRCLEACGVENIVVVVGPELLATSEELSKYNCIIQKDRLGTGHAVKIALEEANCLNDDIVIVCGDAPLLTPNSLDSLMVRQQRQSGLVLMAFDSESPGSYGRVVNDGEKVKRIVEASEASDEELDISLCNSGVLMAPGRDLLRWLGLIDNKNSKGEYYLTDVIEKAVQEKCNCEFVKGEETELLGVNTKIDLANAEKILQERYRTVAMSNGVTLQDPATTFLSFDTQFGEDVHVGPFTVFGTEVKVGNNVVIKGFCHFEGATIGNGSVIGPYARLRPGAETQQGVRIGNFVEIKNSKINNGAKINHLSYVGDAEIGESSNVGAGTITANFDGYNKSRTVLGSGVSIGSNSVLVAPVVIGDNAITGAGAIVRNDVAKDTIVVSDQKQIDLEERASDYRKRKQEKLQNKKEDS